MNFHTRVGNFLKTDNSTSKIMNNLLIALFPIYLFAFYKNGLLPIIKGYGDIGSLFHLLLVLILPCLVCLGTEYLWYNYLLKEKRDIKYFVNDTYALIPGLFLSLIIPINTPIYLLILGSLFMIIIGKLIYGGFGHNFLNPALVGRFFIMGCYGAIIGKSGGYLNLYEKSLDTIAGATPLGNLASLNYSGSYQNIITPFGSIWNFLIGNIPGAIGETSSLLILLALIYLILNKVIKWRIPVYYLGTVFVSTMIIGFANGMGLWYPLFHLLSGGLLFGAVFMATDPVTSPLTKNSQIIYGISLGILTLFFRFLTSYPEGVCVSILIMNLVVLLLNKFDIISFSKKYLNLLVLSLVVGILVIFTIVISFKVKNSASLEDESFKILDKKVNGHETTYLVNGKGFGGMDSYKVKVTFKNDYIVSIDVLENKESYYNLLESSNYLNKIIINQSNLDNLDTVSGATYSSKFLKELIVKVQDDYKRK